MWTYERKQELGFETLLFFVKGAMERNTIIASPATEEKIQELITMWEAEDAAAETQEVI